MNSILCSEHDARATDLRRRLDEFYNTTQNYQSFEGPNDKPEFWDPIRRDIQAKAAAKGRVRVLEFGAGYTGFRRYLGELADSVDFDVQDVTPRHLDYLKTQARNVYVGDVREIRESYDVIFSTFVWEHITTPAEVLDHLLKRLDPGGTLFIAAPRYDFPGYLSPSVRHYSLPRRLALSLWLPWKRLAVLLGGKPKFYIHVDPAVLHVPWFRDADAIHWASWWDLKKYISSRRGEGFSITRIRVPVSGAARKVWEKYLLLFVRIDRAATARPTPAPGVAPA